MLGPIFGPFFRRSAFCSLVFRTSTWSRLIQFLASVADSDSPTLSTLGGGSSKTLVGSDKRTFGSQCSLSVIARNN